MIKKNFEWEQLQIYNYHNDGKLKFFINYIKKNIHKEGNLFEAGVFRGANLIGIGLLLKNLKSKKKIYGFDTFSGFPKNIYHENDKIKNYKKLYAQNLITKSHYNDHIKYLERNMLLKNIKLNGEKILNNSNFKKNSLKLIIKKIQYLGLNNIILVNGTFEQTFQKYSNLNFLGGIIDCDLYKSYKQALDFFALRLIKKGEIFLDEYYSLKYPGARIACNEFIKFNKHFRLEKYPSKLNEFDRWKLKRVK